jgi:CHAD domain-containing protein
MRLDATAWLEHLDDARTLALAGDVEGVHQVRVSARRLSVWLGFKKHSALQDELRWLCGALALLRDLDVFGEVFTEAASNELRPRAMDEAVEALQSERWFKLRDRLKQVRAPKRSKAKRALRKLERKLVEQQLSLPERDGAALHRLRRSLRRVRYAREWLGLEASDLAREQDGLGAACDLLALEAFARKQHADVPESLASAIARAFEFVARAG